MFYVYKHMSMYIFITNTQKKSAQCLFEGSANYIRNVMDVMSLIDIRSCRAKNAKQTMI